jgi:hypothetical protein
MSSGWAASFVAEFCGVPDFPTAERAMPQMTRRVATRKRLILASVIQKRIPDRGRDRQRARLGRAPSEAARCSCHGIDLVVKRAESPTGSVEWILEIERVKLPARSASREVLLKVTPILVPSSAFLIGHVQRGNVRRCGISLKR